MRAAEDIAEAEQIAAHIEAAGVESDESLTA